MRVLLLAAALGPFGLQPASASTKPPLEGKAAASLSKAPSPKAQLQSFLSSSLPQSAALVQTDGKTRVTGSIAVAKGGKMRWEEWRGGTLETLAVSDGKASWLYEPGLQQATRLRANSDGWVSLLQHPDQLERNYRVLEKGSALVFLPKDAEQVPATLELKNGKPLKLTTKDLQGKTMVVTFGQWKASPGAQFSFMPPRGVDIVDQR